MESKKENGTLKTLEELYAEAKGKIAAELDTMDTEDALYLGNKIRDKNKYDRLYKNNEESINEVLDGESPWNILNKGWEDYSDFFTYDWDLNMTNDVWYDLDTEDIAEEILDGNYHQYITSDIKDIVDEYEETKDLLENYNPLRAEGVDLLTKYVDGKADVTDLLQYIDRLTKTDEAWEEN